MEVEKQITKKAAPIERLTKKEEREITAGNLKERVYSTITLLAVMAIIWQHAENHSTLGAIGTIFGTVIALWAATLISARISHRAITGKPIKTRQYMKVLYKSAGLLVPAVAPIALIAFGGLTGLYDLQMAVGVAIFINLLFLFAISYFASQKIYNSILRQLLVSTLEMSVGVGVILLKLAIGK